MYKNFILNILIVLLAGLLSCSGPKGVVVDGEITGYNNQGVYLEQYFPDNTFNTLFSSESDGNGKFTLNATDGLSPGFYRLKFSNLYADLILDGTEKKVNVNGEKNKLPNYDYSVTGSKDTESFLHVIEAYRNKEMNPADIVAYIKTDASPLVAYALGLRMFGFRPEYLDMHKEILNKLNASYPNVFFLEKYKMQIAGLEANAQSMMAREVIKVGQPAPEIALPNPEGKILKLSDYKGKVVLLDFWASWCGPCRKSNPHVVEMYEKYKSQGFDVFSVSLDGVDSRTASRMGSDAAQLASYTESQKQRWLEAISKDNLTWPGHVSDLKKWDCAPAKQYGVSSIPRTFLIGRDGNIVAVNPRYNLEEEIKKNL